MEYDKELETLYLSGITDDPEADLGTVQTINSLARDVASALRSEQWARLLGRNRLIMQKIKHEKVGVTTGELLAEGMVDTRSYLLGHIAALEIIISSDIAYRQDRVRRRQMEEELENRVLAALSRAEQPLDERALVASIYGVPTEEVELASAAAELHCLALHGLVAAGLASECELPEGKVGFTAMQRIG